MHIDAHLSNFIYSVCAFIQDGWHRTVGQSEVPAFNNHDLFLFSFCSSSANFLKQKLLPIMLLPWTSEKAVFIITKEHPSRTHIFFLSPREMKEEIETKHFEHTRGSRDEPRCRATPHQTGRGVCVSPQPLPWVLSCDEC